MCALDDRERLQDRNRLSAPGLIHRLPGSALSVLKLALAVALVAEISLVEKLIPDLLQGQSTAGGVFRPRYISAMKIAGINRIVVKLFKRP